MTERDERMRQIRERQLRRGRSTDADLNVPRTEKEDIDYLLSLLDSQATEKEFAARTPIGIQIANHAATRMRDRCVDAIKTLRATPHGAAYNNAINDAIRKVESLTLEGEQEKP